MFLSHRTGKALGVKGVWWALREAFRRRGLPAIKPYSLRVSAATDLLAGGMSLFAISRLLGHAKLQTTQSYLRVETVELARELSRKHPRNAVESQLHRETERKETHVMTLDDYVDRFREHLEITHASPRTVETYCDCARTFVAFLRRSYPRTTGFQRVSRDVALDYQRYLQNRKNRNGRPLSPRSHAAYIKALRKLFAFLLSESVVLHNPFASLTLPREGRPLPRNILSQEEVVELLRNMKARDPVGVRNRAIVELLYACGMRTSELCSLRVGDVDLQGPDRDHRSRQGRQDTDRTHRSVREPLRRAVPREKARRHMLKGRKEDPGGLVPFAAGQPLRPVDAQQVRAPRGWPAPSEAEAISATLFVTMPSSRLFRVAVRQRTVTRDNTDQNAPGPPGHSA